jgi:hypothetical protein
MGFVLRCADYGRVIRHSAVTAQKQAGRAMFWPDLLKFGLMGCSPRSPAQAIGISGEVVLGKPG